MRSSRAAVRRIWGTASLVAAAFAAASIPSAPALALHYPPASAARPVSGVLPRPGLLAGRWRSGYLPGPWAAVRLPGHLASAQATAGRRWRAQQAPNPVMPNGALTASSCAGTSACVAVGDYEDAFGTGHSLAERWDGARWRTQPVPDPAGAAWSGLFAVSCASPGACTAAGYYVTAAGNLLGFAERWDGTRWAVQHTPSPAGSRGSGLFGISCPSAAGCVAVGVYVTQARAVMPLTEEWNGTTWLIRPAPSPAGSRAGELVAVSCSSPGACTAAGDQVTLTGADVTLAERWNGTSWAVQITPNPAGAQGAALSAISCVSDRACTAAGSYGANAHGDPAALAEAWNGTAWHVQATPFLPGPTGAHGGSLFSAVSCSGVKACTAVGTYVGRTLQQVSLAERWNGTRWVVQATPSLARSLGTSLSAVSCPAASACVAAGSFPVVLPASFISGVALPALTLAEAWHGTRWHIQATPSPDGATVEDALTAVSCVSARECTAVGSYTDVAGSSVADAERWNGSRWVLRPAPRPAGSLDTSLADVSCTSPGACTAVGSATSASFTGTTLAERWNGTRWAIQPTPTPRGAAAAALFAVSCTSARACIAVGSVGKGLTLAEGWNGARWATQATPRPHASVGADLTGVSCVSARSCIAVGSYSTKASRQVTLAERWNGVRWTIQPAPSPPNATLAAVSCTSSRACTAVGASSLSTGSQRALAETWNGRHWVIQPTPRPAAGSELSGVSCTSPRSCTAVGNEFLSNGATLTLTLAWNGTRWRLQAGPSLTAYDSGLSAVSCPGPRSCTAAGSYFGLTGFSLNLAIATSG